MKRLFFCSLLLLSQVAYAAGPHLFVQGQSLAGTGSIPQGTQRVPMLTVTLSASCDGDITISSMQIQHRGKGDSSDILRIYAMDGNRRLSRSATFDDDAEATLRFRNWTLTACSSKTLKIFADISPNASAGAEHILSIVSNSAIEAGDASVSVSTVQSSEHTRLTPSSSGIISVSYPSLNTTVTYGSNRIVGRIRLSADTGDDHLIHAITLTNDGKARNADLTNIRLESSNRAVISSLAPFLDGETVRLTFDPPLLLGRNEEKVFLIKANVKASRRQTIRFLIEEPGDIESASANKR